MRDVGEAVYKAKMIKLDKGTDPEEWAEKMRMEEALTTEDKAAGIIVVNHDGKGDQR